MPTSYGVYSQAHHFWDGPGRSNNQLGAGEGVKGGKDEHNFYENYAEDTQGKRRPSETAHTVPGGVPVMSAIAANPSLT